MRGVSRPMPASGLGDLEVPPNQAGGWIDCDRALVEPPDIIRPWPGANRVGQRLFSDAVMGTSSNVIQIIRASQDWIRKKTGHLIAAVDRSANSDGRVLGLAHHENGRLGTQLVGDATQTTGTGLSDISTRGVYTGITGAIYVVRIDAAATPDTFEWSNDGGATFGTTGVSITGSFQTLENGIQVEFAATTGHTLSDAWTFGVGGRPMLAGTLNRLGPHDYVSMAGAEGKVLIASPWDTVKVDDGETVREAGLTAPYIQPIVCGNFASTTEIGDTDATPTNWVAVGAATVTRDMAIKADGTASINITIPTSLRRGGVDLAYVNVAGTIRSTTKRMTFWLRSEHHIGRIRGRTFSLIVASAVALGGTRVQLIARPRLRGKRWTLYDVSWKETADFTFASVGLRLRRSIWHHRFTGGELEIWIDGIETDGDSGNSGLGSTAPSDLFATDTGGEWFFAFTWMRTSDRRESGLSPWFGPMDLNDSSVNIDITGFHPGIETDLQNAAPDGADAIQVYVANKNWGPDARLGLFLSFFRLTPVDGALIADLISGGNGELFIDFADENETGEINDAALNERSPFMNTLVKPGNVLIPDGNLIVSLDIPDFSVGSWTFTNGSHLITPVVAGASDTPVVHRFMEGRQIQAKGETDSYRILKALDTTGNGVLDTLFIGTDFDADAQELLTAYKGTTGAKEAVIRGDGRSIRWTNNSEQLGVDPEASGPLQRLKVMPAGDRLVGGGKIDEFIWAIGSQQAAIMRQNPSALSDNLIAEGFAYSNPIYVPGVSMMAPRTFVNRVDGTALWMGARGELWVGSANQAVRHPVSKRLASLLQGWGLLIDTRDLRHSFADIVSDGRREYYFLQLISGFDEESVTTDSAGNETTYEPGVTRRRQNLYDFHPSGFPSSGSLTPAPAAPFTYDAAADCIDIGAQYNTDELTNDFFFGILIDLETNEIYCGAECRFTTAGISPASSCTTSGQVEGPSFFGDRDGFIWLTFDERLLTWGSPDNRFIHEADDAAPGSSTTFLIDTAIGGNLITVALPVDDELNGNDLGLACAKFTPSTGVIEYRRVVSNTADTVTISASHTWDTNPVAEDLLILGPLPFLVQWAEFRTRAPHLARRVLMDLDSDLFETEANLPDFVPQGKWQTFTANGAGVRSNNRIPVESELFDAGRMDIGLGQLSLAAAASKASSQAMTLLGGQSAPVRTRNVNVEYLIHENDAER